MAYDLNVLQSQLQDLSRQYQQLANNQPIQQYTPQVQIPIQIRQVQFVEGIQGARLYQEKNLQSNSSEIVLDKNENIFYYVSKDANGTPARDIPVCRFEIEDKVEEPTYLTRKDFDDFKEEIRQLLTTTKTTTTSSTSKVIKKEG